MADHLPEHVIVQILERLPTKSLIRFTSVSKRWRFIILSDPHFAMSQFQIASHHQTLRRRLLISTGSRSGFKSLDLNTPSQSPLGDICSVRCPLTQQPGGRPIRILCSCNGLILATLHHQENNMYIWNPSTQFVKNLPDPADLASEPQCLLYYGFGYLSATDDYKVIANFEVFEVSDDDYDGDEVEVEGKEKEMHIFSSKANIWKRTEAPLHSNIAAPLHSNIEYEGTLSNEALHWLEPEDNLGVLAFDLAKEEFRRLPLPILDGDFRELRAFGDCLCAFDCANVDVDLWVMKEYGVADSWTKLFKLKVSDQPEEIVGWWPVSVNEASTFLQKGTLCRGGGLVFDFIRSVHTEENPEMHVLSRDTDFREMIEYQETLLWLG